MVITAGEMLAGSVVNPGTLALAIITAGSARRDRALERQEAGVLEDAPRLRRRGRDVGVRDAWPSPGKCLTTGITPPASSPCMNAIPSAAAMVALRLNDRVPSGSWLLGPTPLSRSSTGARSMVIPAACMRSATLVTSWRICAADIVAAICLADGIEPTRFAMRCTTPPSSSVITNGAMPPGAASESACRLEPRLAGAEDPKRITPPAPAATSAVTAATSDSSTGTTRVCSASRVRLQVARTLGFVQTLGVAVGASVGAGESDGVAVGAVDPVGVAVVPGKRTRSQNRGDCGDGEEPGDNAAHAGYTGRMAKRARMIPPARYEDQNSSRSESMKFGVVLPGGTATQQLEQAILAEQSGWDGVFVWEAAYGVDAWTLLAAMAPGPNG